jgi:hypothetical protein
MVESDNVFERLYGLVRFNDECSHLHGVYRTKILKDAWDYVPASMCAGCDLVLLAKVAALGRFVYVKGIEYIRRDLRDHDTLAAYLERLHPDNVPEPDYYLEMVNEHIRVVAKVHEPNRIKKRFWQERIRFQLVRRYGFLRSGILWDDALAGSLYFGYRIRAKIARLFGVTPQNELLAARRYPAK